MTKTASSSTRAIKPRTQKAEESCRKPQRTPTTWFSAATGERLHSSSTTKRTTSVPLTEKARPPPAPRTASTSPQRFSPLHRAFGSRGLRFRGVPPTLSPLPGHSLPHPGQLLPPPRAPALQQEPPPPRTCLRARPRVHPLQHLPTATQGSGDRAPSKRTTGHGNLPTSVSPSVKQDS